MLDDLWGLESRRSMLTVFPCRRQSLDAHAFIDDVCIHVSRLLFWLKLCSRGSFRGLGVVGSCALGQCPGCDYHYFTTRFSPLHFVHGKRLSRVLTISACTEQSG